MANIKSAEKRMRQAQRRRDQNRADRSRMRSQVKKLHEAIAAGDGKLARELLAPTLRLIDDTAGKQVTHRNAAARTKSRLALAVGKLPQ